MVSVANTILNCADHVHFFYMILLKKKYTLGHSGNISLLLINSAVVRGSAFLGYLIQTHFHTPDRYFIVIINKKLSLEVTRHNEFLKSIPLCATSWLASYTVQCDYLDGFDTLH